MTKRHPVWFNKQDFTRYSKLKLKTPFHQKVKEVFNRFLEKEEKNVNKRTK